MSRPPRVFGELSDELGGIDRVIVNAGIGKGWPLGEGKPWANKATIETNLVAGLVQIETALEMFKKSGGRAPGAHLVGAGQHRCSRYEGRILRQQGGG